MRRTKIGLILVFACVIFASAPASVPAQNAPVASLFWAPNIFFGDIPPGGERAPVIVFVHGINGIAQDWWAPPNDMYALAFAAGYRTAFVNLSANGTRNNDGIIPNATVLRKALVSILIKFNAPSVYIVAHSKGGVDVEGAMLDQSFSFYVKAVFTIATPNFGAEVADWAASTGAPLSPALEALRIDRMAAFRSIADPVAVVAGVPYYTISASNYAVPPHPLTTITGPILSQLTGGVPNDGVLTVPRSRLSAFYSFDLGDVPVSHFAAATGNLVFPRINAQIRTLEAGTVAFKKIATGGFSSDGDGNALPGDRQNSFPWSTQWFKGKLYVGTGRAFLCVVAATNDAATGSHTYATPIPNVECTPDPKDLPLAAEIWRYTPETRSWERVYQSPQDVPIEFDAAGTPTKFTARDIAFRGMAVFTENDTGVERLYIGGISASSLYDTLPGYQDPAVRRFPAPRMLWTEDGTTWNAVPQTPGTFFGDLNVQTEKVNKRGFRSFLTLPDANGVNRLFATVSDLRGVGRVIESSNPSAGDNAWRQVSPSADDLPIFTIATYRDQIYATVGDDGFPNGYAIYKTDAATPDAADPSRYQFMPVVVGDGSQLMRARTAISMQEFHGDLYVGSDRPTELIRIHPDDTWDLIVGAARMTSSGFKVPLSGLNKGFNSMFNGHFYSMAAYNGDLYLGTWDWSQDLIGTPLDGIFNYQYGFDLFKTDDGVHWSVIDRRGLGDRLNSSVRNLEATPFGLFVGATNPYFGLQIFLNSTVLDLNRDGVIDNDDIYIVVSSQNQPAESPSDPRDLDRDGVITLHDAELFATQCTHPDCSHGAASNVDPPTGLEAVFQNGTPPLVGVTWNGPSTASRYHVFRSDPTSLVDLLPPTMTIPLPNGSTITVQDIRNGALDIPCQAGIIPADFCALVQAVRENTTSTRGFHWIGSTSNLYFLDTSPPASGDSLYYVVAEDASGRISEPTPAVSTVGR